MRTSWMLALGLVACHAGNLPAIRSGGDGDACSAEARCGQPSVCVHHTCRHIGDTPSGSACVSHGDCVSGECFQPTRGGGLCAEVQPAGARCTADELCESDRCTAGRCA